MKTNKLKIPFLRPPFRFITIEKYQFSVKLNTYIWILWLLLFYLIFVRKYSSYSHRNQICNYLRIELVFSISILNYGSLHYPTFFNWKMSIMRNLSYSIHISQMQLYRIYFLLHTIFLKNRCTTSNLVRQIIENSFDSYICIYEELNNLNNTRSKLLHFEICLLRTTGGQSEGQIVLSYEATFKICGKTIRQNFWYWSNENLHWLPKVNT